MAVGHFVRRGGAYNRLAEPAWENPLDISVSQAHGGRWNAPGSYGALYLNRTVAMARAQVAHKLAGQPYGVEDLDGREQHDLVGVHVPDDDYLDCLTDLGLRAVGLPESYPHRPDGGAVSWEECQPVAAAAREDGLPGVACRSAVEHAPPDGEELAVFDRATAEVTVVARRPFADWYFG